MVGAKADVVKGLARRLASLDASIGISCGGSRRPCWGGKGAGDRSCLLVLFTRTTNRSLSRLV